jgi:hypothetical protein
MRAMTDQETASVLFDECAKQRERIAVLEAALSDALQSFKLTQRPDHYPVGHWSRRAEILLSE